jgi:hypothetical protein
VLWAVVAIRRADMLIGTDHSALVEQFLEALKEHSSVKGLPGYFVDVDSGPIILGRGSAASAFGIGAARALGRHDQAVPLLRQAVAVSWPTSFGWLVPSVLVIAAIGSVKREVSAWRRCIRLGDR